MFEILYKFNLVFINFHNKTLIYFRWQKTEITEFLGFFYKHSMHILTAPLFANTSEDRPSKGSRGKKYVHNTSKFSEAVKKHHCCKMGYIY